MFRPRPTVPGGVLLLALGAMALPVPSALAQQPPAQQPLSVMTIALLYTEDEAVDDELKVSEEQVRKLSEHRTKWFNDYWNPPPGRGTGRASGPGRAGELSRANDKALAEIFKPEQLKRLRELTLQAVERQYGGRALRYPEVAEELKLSEEQLTRARTEGPEAVLTREQKAKWQGMKGDAFKGALKPQIPERPPAAFSAGNNPLRATPAPLRTVQYLFSKSVQAELKLTDEQRTRVRELRDQWRAAPAASFRVGGRREQTAREIEQAAGDLLRPEQKARLEQVAIQVKMRSRPADAVFTLPEVVGALKLSAKQQKKLATLRRERQAAYRDLFLTGEGSDEIARKAEAFRKETYAKLAAVLSDEQQAGLKGVLGEPFTGSVVSINGTRKLPPLPLIIAGLPFVEDKALHRELKLSEEQVGKLVEESRKYRSLGPAEAVDRATEKAVGDILSADQLKRFKQLVLQQAPGRGIAGYTDVVDGLKLTDEQKQEFSDGEPPDTVLTRDQQAKWKEMLGEPFKGTLTQALPAGVSGFRVPPPVVRYLEQSSVQDELKLSDEQRRQVKDLTPLWQKAANEPDAMKVVAKAVTDMLKPEQERRLRQIMLQQAPKGIPGAVLAAEGVADKLSLTADQQQQIKAIKENDARVRALINNDNALNPREPGRLTLSVPVATHNALARVTDDKLFGLLTEDQKAKLKELLGEPFKGDLGTPFGRRDLPPFFPALPSFAPPS
jgi:hypothetical protein